MYIDKELELSDGQALTASARSTNIIDLGYAGADLGTGEQLYAVFQCDVAMGGTSPTLDIKLETDSVEAMSSPTALIEVPQKTALAAGDQIVVPIPPTAERYLAAYYTLGGMSPTVTLSAFITKDVQNWSAKPDAL